MLGVIKLLCHFSTVESTRTVQTQVSLQHAHNPSVASPQLFEVTAVVSAQANTSTLQVADLLRPLVLYMQFALILASVTGVQLPAPLAYPLQALAWSWSPAVPETLSIECILPHGSSSSIPVSIQRMLFYLAMPFVM
jgi:hypothetical protein